jgi:hypothetical protein
MENTENFSGTNLREQIEKAIHTEELAYPIRLVDFNLRNFNFKNLGVKPHYWNIIQIHELLDDSKVFPEKLDDNIWYQYISTYLILPKTEQLIETNRSAWNSTEEFETEFENEVIIKEAVWKSLKTLGSRPLSNKVAKSNQTESSDSFLINRFKTVLSRKELSYPVNLLEISLRKLEIKIHYPNIISMHEFLKYAGILPAEYNYNLWYRCIAAYIIASYVDVDKLIELNKYGWTESARKGNEELVLRADIITLL